MGRIWVSLGLRKEDTWTNGYPFYCFYNEKPKYQKVGKEKYLVGLPFGRLHARLLDLPLKPGELKCFELKEIKGGHRTAESVNEGGNRDENKSSKKHW